ncbi:hypothetical protein, partial [Schlesneria sp.]|uniref:hypothetical protein n=1 Tax=Schlesneria sp. TaxID=2762018 RepID=UPI002F258444
LFAQYIRGDEQSHSQMDMQMECNEWSERNDSLNAFNLALKIGTHGLIRDIVLDLASDGSVIVWGRARNYYAIQLAICATREFGSRRHLFPKTRLLLSVGESVVDLEIVHPEYEKQDQPLPTPRPHRRISMTMTAAMPAAMMDVIGSVESL